jgi:hypothetical protein
MWEVNEDQGILVETFLYFQLTKVSWRKWIDVRCV